MDNSNFMLNSGSLFIIMTQILLFAILKFIWIKIAVAWAYIDCIRSITMFSSSHKLRLLLPLNKLVMETYFDLAMAVLLQLNAYLISFLPALEFTHELLNCLLCGRFLLVLAIFPFIMHFLARKKYQKKDSKN